MIFEEGEIIEIIPSCLKMIFEEGEIIDIIPSCLKMIFKEGGIIKIISTFVYFIKPKRCDRILIIYNLTVLGKIVNRNN